MADPVRVEVACATADRQVVLALEVPAGTNARDAVMRSGLAHHFPELDMARCPLGIFGKVLAEPQGRVLSGGERVEVYRPLLADPKEARKRRAAKASGRLDD